MARNIYNKSLVINYKRDIDIVGWGNYFKEYTLIVLALVILYYFKSFNIPISFLDYIVDVFLQLLLFATQFLGIGAIYCRIKDKKMNI